MTACEYSNVEHSCGGDAQWRIWADVTMQWHYACPAAVDALVAPSNEWSASGAVTRGSGRITVVMEAVR